MKLKQMELWIFLLFSVKEVKVPQNDNFVPENAADHVQENDNFVPENAADSVQENDNFAPENDDVVPENDTVTAPSSPPVRKTRTRIVREPKRLNLLVARK